jgi:hypothetical protein
LEGLVVLGLLQLQIQGPGFHGVELVGRQLGRLLKPVLHQQVEVVALVEELDLDLRVQLSEAPGLAVLLGHQLLVQGGDLDVEVVVGQVEVRAETLDRLVVLVPLEGELSRLVLPGDPVEVEQFGELALRVVREADPLMRELLVFQG